MDQFVPGFARYDAISNHVLMVRSALRAEGFDSDIYGESIDPALAGEARPYLEAESYAAANVITQDRVLLFHASTHSPMAAWIAERAKAGQRVFADYHNITPAPYFARWLPDVAEGMATARRELADLAPHVEFGFADSGFNEAELRELGYADTATCSLLVDLDRYHAPPDAKVLARLRRVSDGGGRRWLFVGRFSPNKCMHDVIAAFAVYRRLFDPKASLTAIGGVTAPRYFRALQRLTSDLELGDSVELLNQVDDAELLAYFAASDAFVCLSEHEGFCVPVLESMELGLPVVAYAAAAVPETVAEAGILLQGKDPLDVALAVADLLADDTKRASLVEAGHRRARHFELARTSAHLVATLRSRLDPLDGG